MGFKLRDQSDSPTGPDDELADVSAPSKKKKKKKKGLGRSRIAAAKGLAILPSLFTLANGLCGFASIFLASRPKATEPAMSPDLPFGWTPLTFAALFIFLGMVFDALDGTIARLTGQTSDLGGQLDSMSDMVTFGVSPAFLAVQLVDVETPFLSVSQDHWFDRLTLLIAGIYVACTALRLARFNIEIDNPEESDHMSFKGLPSPGAAGTVGSLVLLHEHFLARATDHPGIAPSSVAMVAIMLLVAVAMVSRLRYAHVINRYVRGRAPVEYIAIAVSIGLLLAIWPQRALAAGLVIYALSAPSVWLWRKLSRRPEPATGPSNNSDAQQKQDADQAP